MKIPTQSLKKVIVLLCVLIGSSRVVIAQVSGAAFLYGQSSHTGIKVKFTANSGTAITDSCLTDATGHYSKNISGGLYAVTLTYPGYQTVRYLNGANVVVTSTTVLNTVTMNPGNAVFVSGNVSGNWVNTNTYYVNSDLSVPASTTLNIQAGTIIRFAGYHSIVVNGVLIANGSMGSRIVFTSNQTAPIKSNWNKIKLMTSGSVFNFCTLEYADLALDAQPSAGFSVTNSILRHTGVGAILSNNAGFPITISNNEIYDFNTWGVAIHGLSTTGAVSCNHIHLDSTYVPNQNVNSYGIRCSAPIVVSNNHIHHVQKGIDILEQPVIVKNNFLHHNLNGMYLGQFGGTPTASISNNTFMDNDYGVQGLGPGAPVLTRFTSNLVVGNRNGFSFWGGIECDHNLFFGNVDNFTVTALTGAGQVVANNSNGDPIDSYYNVFADPKLVNPHQAYVQSSSPIYNAGNTDYKNYIGADAAAICYENITVGMTENAREPLGFSLFPNPSSGSFTLALKAKAQVIISDMLGNIVLSGSFIAGKHVLEMGDFENGIYIAKVFSEGTYSTSKIIKE